jgi:hypothetical protein
MPNNAELQAQQAILDRLKKKGTPGVAPDRRQPAAPAAATERPRCSGQSCISSPSVAPLFGEQPHESYGFKDNVDFAAVAAAVEQAGAPLSCCPTCLRCAPEPGDVNRITAGRRDTDIIYSKEKVLRSRPWEGPNLKYSFVKKGMKKLTRGDEIFHHCATRLQYNRRPRRIPSDNQAFQRVRDRSSKTVALQRHVLRKEDSVPYRSFTAMKSA